MRKLVFITLLTLAALCFACRGFAQGVVYAPLMLFTNGAGSISPLEDGQLLEVGQSYEMEAIPDSGYEFSSWQPVNVYILTATIDNLPGIDPPTYQQISINPSPVFQYIAQSVLDFTMQPVNVIFDNPGSTSLTESYGWQANFVPTPEPSSLELTACGITVIVFLRSTFKNNFTTFRREPQKPP
jgi:hypothetical protein